VTRQDLDAKMSEIFRRHSVFFAFSAGQYQEQARPGTKYVNCGAGMVCPEGQVAEMTAELEAAIKAFHAADLAENGKTKIIWRELANYEAQITHDITDTAEALKGYGITREEILAEWPAYLRHCLNNDLF